MELREIRSFIILAEQLHFGRAAQLVHLSQPALTKQIRRLEQNLGGQLFLRGKAGTQLTSYGKRFPAEARQMVDDFDRLLERNRRMLAGETGTLRIGFGF